MDNITTHQSVSFTTAANNLRQKLRSSKLSPKTIKTYESIIESQLMPRLSNYQLSEISPADVDRFIGHYSKLSITPAYVKMIKRVMLLILNDVGEQSYVTKRVSRTRKALDSETAKTLPTEAQAKLEAGIRENDEVVLMSVLMHENISISKLLALGIDDVNEASCEITIRRKMLYNGNKFELAPVNEIQTISISHASMELLLTEIRKHLILLSKKRYQYSNPERLIFTDFTGAPYKPSYYISKFKQLSKSVGFRVSPKFLSEFVYVERAVNALNESECKQVTVSANGKKYHYVKISVPTKTGRKTISAPSIDELREKYQTYKNPYAFRLTKNHTLFSEHCQDELAHMNHLGLDEKKKLTAILDKHLLAFCSKFTVNQVDDKFQAKLMKYLDDKHCKLSTREQIRGFLRKVCDGAVKKNFIRYNPFINVTLKDDPAVKYHALSENEIAKIMKLDSNDVNNAFLQVKLLTGTRTSEALGLSWNDIVNNKQILIRNQLRGNKIIHTTKNHKQRKITPPSLAFEILDKVRAKTFTNPHNNLKLIFCNDDGTPLKTDLLHDKLRSTIGRNNARLHDLRVTAITVLYKTTNNLALASKEAGHSGTDVTVKHYVDVVPELSKAKFAQDMYYEDLKNEVRKENIS